MKNLIDEEGENRAVRMFLALYGGHSGVTKEQMRKHLQMSGFDGAWPEWVTTHDGHLTKGGAQLWIRHLFSLEPAREWVGLTDEQRKHVVEMWKGGNWTAGDIIDAVEAAHGITGEKK